MTSNETEPRLLQPYEVSRAAYKCGTIERKLLYYAALIVQKKPYTAGAEFSGYVAEFSLYDFCKKMLGNTSGVYFQTVKKALKAITENTIVLADNDDELKVLSWLQEGYYSQKLNKVVLVFTDKIGKMFVECRERFSLINPAVIGSLTSFYAMRYYEIGLSYSGFGSSWYFVRTIDELRQTFRIDSYTGAKGTNNFITKVVTQPLEELNAVNHDFRIDVVKIPDETDKRKLNAVKFVCTRTATKKPKRRAKAGQADTADAYSAYLAQGGDLMQSITRGGKQ